MRKADHESHAVIRERLDEWETTNTDFKEQLRLGRDGEKAEAVRDVLAMANTQTRGRRLVIIGINDVTRAFSMSVDESITQNRLEQILNAQAAPMPRITYTRVPWGSGTLGVIEVHRQAEELPYLPSIRARIRHLNPGVVYVRHGSQTEPATDAESAAIVAEGERARARIEPS